MVGKVVTKTRAMIWEWVMLYKATMQLVLLYGIESWVVMGCMLKLLEGLHHMEATRILGMTAYRATSGDWERPPLAEALETEGILPIKEYPTETGHHCSAGGMTDHIKYMNGGRENYGR